MTIALDAFEYAARQFQVAAPSPYLNDPVGWAQHKLGVHLWSKQRAIAESVVANRRTAVKSCHNAGKCTSFESMIQLVDGTVARAEDLIGRCFVIPTWSEDGSQRPGIAWATDNGIKPLFRITTTSGRSIDRTGNHPLWAAHRVGGGSGRRLSVAPVGWTNVERLTVNDLVLVPEQLRVEGQIRQTDEDVKFLGYMLGDGSTTQSVGFTQMEGPAKDEFRKLIASYGCQTREHQTNKYGIEVVGPDGERFGRKGSNPVLERLRSWDLLGKKAIHKRFPDWAWRLPNDQLALLLNRLFACDGWASVPTIKPGHKQGANVQIAIGLSCEGMIRDVELAMLRLGILGTVRARTSAYDDSGRRFKSWNWTATRLEDLRRFQEVVGIYGKEAAVARAVEAKESFDGRARHWMRSKAPEGYRWEQITSIEPLGEQPTVCISVPDTHAYVTTFVEHNSWTAGMLAAWWIDVHPPGEAFIVSTAPSYPQVHAILWEEIRKTAKIAAKADNPLPGRILQSDEWKLDDGTLVGWGRKPADTDQHGFQGIHRRYVLVLLDEACGIPEQLWTAVEAITTGGDCRILAIGNPDDPNTEFGKVCRPGSGWNTIKVSAFDTPNFTDEPFPEDLRPLMLSTEWAEDKKLRWGETSPRYISKVLGEFPEVGDDTLISPRWIEAAQQCTLEPGPHVVLGVDVARFGADSTIFALAQGPVIRIVAEHSKQRTTEVTGLVIAAKREHQVDEIHVDGVGVGSGVVDELLEAGHDVVDMQSGAAALDSEHFANARAEWWWGLRQRFEAGDIDIDPADDELASQLGSIKYKFTARGQVLIESKVDMKKRGLPSPDRGDAVMLAKARAPLPDEIVEGSDLDDDLAEHVISMY